MADTTQIFELPIVENTGGASYNPSVKRELETEIIHNETSIQPINQETINQIINGIQQASIYGATKLPSRDIPMIPSQRNNDEQVQPNYIPPTNRDYIRKNEENEDIIKNYNNKKNISSSIDEAYNNLIQPLLLSVLYFIFQLPFFRNKLYQYFPFLFFNDHNMNLNGYLFTSILFGFCNFIINYCQKSM